MSEKFRLGRYWIDTVPGSARYYRFWYDARTGKVSRKSLGTADFEAAKLELAVIALKKGGNAEDPGADGSKPREPDQVLLITCLTHYWVNYSDKRPRKGNARYAAALLTEYLAEVLPRAPRVSDLTKARQEAYMRHAHAKGLSVGTISRNLSIVRAALAYSAEEQIVKDEDGGEETVHLLKYVPPIHYGEAYISKVLSAPMPEPRNWIPSVDELAAFLEDIEHENLWRYCIIALNTWARPEAVCDVSPFAIDRQHLVLNLNPAGRRQTKKFRPVVPITDCLWGWLEHWSKTATEKQKKSGRIISRAGKPVKSIRKVWGETRDRTVIVDGEPVRKHPEALTRYSLRHLMITVARRARVPKEQREGMAGHIDPKGKTNDSYGLYDPDYLKDAKAATDAFMVEVDRAIRALARKEGRSPRRSVFALKSLSKLEIVQNS